MSSRPARPDVALLSQEGYQLLRQSEFEAAVERFREVLDLEPQNAYALVGLADTARKRNRHQEAAELYQQCLEHEPKNTFALFGLADSYRAMRRYPQALSIWERYLEHDDGNVSVLTRVADGYRKVRQKERSRALYLKVLEIEPDNPYALIGLGHLHYDFREFEEALGFWSRMAELAGAAADIRVLTSIGNCQRKLKRFAEGIPWFERALAIESSNFYALFGLADCYRGLNESDRSLEYWIRILRSDPANRVILTRAGDAERSLGNLDEAERYYRQALEEGADVYATIGLAVVARLRRDLGAAFALLIGLSKSEPSNQRVAVELAQTYAESGEPDQAVRILTEFVERTGPNPYLAELIALHGR